MKHIRIGFYLGILFLTLLSACQMGAATPTPVVPAPVTCNQTGCPYPAVCDKNTGVCTIYQTSQAPNTNINNPGPAAGAIVANNPNAGSIFPPACNPIVPSVSNINFYCVNPAKGVGGVTFDYSPSSSYRATTPQGLCGWSANSAQCSGSQGTKFQALICSSCTAPKAPQSYGKLSCSSGTVEDAQGSCIPIDPNNPNDNYAPCPPGSHYDNSKQACVDDKTSALNPQCPAGYPYFLPDLDYCLAKPYPEVYDCQSFTIPLGACPTPKQIKKICTTNTVTGAVTCQ